MGTRRSLRFWHSLWGASLLIGVGIFAVYARLPIDGASGDLGSFTSRGFEVQWLLEERAGGLQVGDVIVRAGGHTVEEWLAGASRGPEWRTGGVVPYEIERDGETLTLPLRLVPVPPRAILIRWRAQLFTALTFFVVGSFVFWRRSGNLSARLVILVGVTAALQYFGDAYNFQVALLPWPGLFWFRIALEHITYGLTYGSICFLTLLFPDPHPLLQRFPRLTPLALYAAFPLLVIVVMGLSPMWSTALDRGNRAIVVVATFELGLALVAVIRSVRSRRDPVARVRLRWLLWSGAIVIVLVMAGYIVPIVLTGRPLIPAPVMTVLNLLVPFVLPLIVVLVLVYFLVKGILARLTDQHTNVAFFVFTHFFATLFQYVRDRLRTFIRRRF